MTVRQFFAILLLVPVLTHADDTVPDILAASTGTWEGELYYLDYGSGKRFGIPLRIVAEMTPDRATLIRRLTFTDPDNMVHAINLSTLERASGELVEAYFREGAAELLRYSIVSTDYSNEEQWQVVYEANGIDDNRPARIRHTIKRAGTRMTSTKEVRFVDDDGDFFLRNGTDVRLKHVLP